MVRSFGVNVFCLHLSYYIRFQAFVKSFFLFFEKERPVSRAFNKAAKAL